MWDGGGRWDGGANRAKQVQGEKEKVGRRNRASVMHAVLALHANGAKAHQISFRGSSRRRRRWPERHAAGWRASAIFVEPKTPSLVWEHRDRIGFAAPDCEPRQPLAGIRRVAQSAAFGLHLHFPSCHHRSRLGFSTLASTLAVAATLRSALSRIFTPSNLWTASQERDCSFQDDSASCFCTSTHLRADPHRRESKRPSQHSQHVRTKQSVGAADQHHLPPPAAADKSVALALRQCRLSHRGQDHRKYSRSRALQGHTSRLLTVNMLVLSFDRASTSL